MTDVTPENTAAEAGKKAAEASKSWVERTSHRTGFGFAYDKGLGAAASKSLEDVKAIVGKGAEGSSRGIGFARVGAVGVGGVMAFDGLMRSKDADGNARSGLVRVGQAVLGTGMVAGGVLMHGRA